ncbi:MAG: hypothetical protein M3069_17385 [Chloroflexota bacterium]|nr:hypothetical protein [Chloroflexota bacterium]
MVLIGLTIAAYARFLSTGFAATDSLPLIETSRLQSLADVGLQFTRPVMAGTRFALGEVVYRPFVAVTFGLDYALWGLNAPGFHATNVGLHVIGVLGVWFLLTRLGLRNWSAAAGAALFALHPLAVASVPVIARRDSVVPVSAFVLGAGLLIGAEQARGARRAWLMCGALVLVGTALLSKESAFAALLMLPMLFAASILARGDSLTTVLKRSGRLIPFIVLAVGVFVARTLVLGGLGHAAEDSNPLVVDWDKYSQVLGAFTRELAWMFAWIAASTREIWPRLAGVALVGLALTIPWLPRRHAVLAAAGVVWVVGFAIFCMVLKIATIAWLAYFSLVGVALVFGAGMEGALERWRVPGPGRFRGPGRAAAGVLLGALGLYTATAVYASPVLRTYDQWQIAGDVTQRFSQALQACVAQAPEATQVRLNALPSAFEDGRVETNLMGVTLLEDWTVDAILRLVFPSRNLTVHVSSWGTLRASADTLQFTCGHPAADAVELTTSY